ncbi:hypothetical protein V6N13_082824 [Hibiscus sabdariffa]
MVNPTELSGENITPTAGPHGGRPVDAILSPTFLPLLEQQGSPISDEKQPVSKRGRCEVDSELTNVVEEEQMDAEFDTTMGDTENRKLSIDGLVHAENLREEPNQKENEDGAVKLSFRDTLVGKALQEIQDEETNINHVKTVTVTQQPREDNSCIQTMAKSDVATSEGQTATARVLEMDLSKEVASNERIIPSDTSLNKEKHTAVKIGNEIGAHISKDRNVHVLPASIRNGSHKVQTKTPVALKGVQRQGSKTTKKDDRGCSRP